MNSPEGAAIPNAVASNMTGDGPSIRPTVSHKPTRDLLIASFGEWWDRCDAEGQRDLAGMLWQIVWLLVVDGEVFVHLGADPDTGELRLRLLSPEQFEGKPDGPGESGGQIVGNVEIVAGRRVAYYIREIGSSALYPDWSFRRVPADDIIHLFEPKFAGQVRGISWLAPVATLLAEVGTLRDALLAKAKTAALYVGVIYNPNATDQGKGFQADELSMEPGAMLKAPPGYSAEFSDPPSTEGAIEFLRSQIRSIAAGAGVPYELVSGDLSQVNYSSARLGLLEFRRRISSLQRMLLVARLLQPVWKRWLLLEGLAGRLSWDVARTAKAEFVFPGWAQIDPMKETQADALAIREGIRSRFEVISTRGRDPEAVAAEIAADTTRGAA